MNICISCIHKYIIYVCVCICIMSRNAYMEYIKDPMPFLKRIGTLYGKEL